MGFGYQRNVIGEMHMRKLSRLLASMVLTLSILGFVQSATAQTATDLQSQMGIWRFGSYHGGDIDTIPLLNGRLMVDVPLISYPQRGDKLKLNFVLHYHNTG